MHQVYGKNSEQESKIFPDTVLIAVASSRNLILTKRQLEGGEFKSYDHVKHFDFYERQVDDLLGLYRLLGTVVNYPRAALIRAVLKDNANWKHIERKFKGEDSTLVNQDQHWFALDVDGFGNSSGYLEADAKAVLLGLGEGFANVDCIALASSSFGYKKAIHLRLFFWSEHKVSNYSLKKHFYNNRVCADINLFNPVQLIYVAKPILLHKDTIGKRMVFIGGDYPTVIVPEVMRYNETGIEKKYTKKQANAFYEPIMSKIQFAEEGTRHNVLYGQGCFLGKLIAQGLIDEETLITDIETISQYCWNSKTHQKDMETFRAGLERGQQSIDDSGDI